MEEQKIDPYLRYILKPLKPTWLSKYDEEDVLQEGRKALWEAERNFDSTKGCKIGTYAKYRVHGAMIRAIDKIGGPIHLSEYSKSNGKKKPRYLRIDAEENRDGIMVPEQLHTNESEQIDMRLDAQRILDRLSKKDRVLFERRYGFGGEQYTFEQIAQLEGISKAAIHKRYKRVISEIRDRLK